VLVSVIAAPRSAFRSGAQSARVKYGRLRFGGPAFRKAQEYAQIVDHRFEYARRESPPRLLVCGFPRRKIVWHIAPSRAGAHDPPQSVEHLAQDRGFVGARPLGRAPHTERQRPTLRRKRRLGMVFESPCQDATVSELEFITHSKPQVGVELLTCTVSTLLPEPPVNGLLCWQDLRQWLLLAATLQNVEDGFDDLAGVVGSRSSSLVGSRGMHLQTPRFPSDRSAG